MFNTNEFAKMFSSLAIAAIAFVILIIVIAATVPILIIKYNYPLTLCERVNAYNYSCEWRAVPVIE